MPSQEWLRALKVSQRHFGQPLSSFGRGAVNPGFDETIDGYGALQVDRDTGPLETGMYVYPILGRIGVLNLQLCSRDGFRRRDPCEVVGEMLPDGGHIFVGGTVVEESLMAYQPTMAR
jgi:hypothetical protein